MEIVSCSARKFDILLNQRKPSNRGTVKRDYVGFKYLNKDNFDDVNNCTVLIDNGKLLCVMSYKVELKLSKHILRYHKTYEHITINYIDVRSDKKDDWLERHLIEDLCSNCSKSYLKLSPTIDISRMEYDGDVDDIVYSVKEFSPKARVKVKK